MTRLTRHEGRKTGPATPNAAQTIDISPRKPYNQVKIQSVCQGVTMKRIYSFDVLKVAFAYLIAIFHFGTELPPGPGITVELFFIISGFFLGKKFYDKYQADPNNDYDQIRYTKDHIKSLYPHYVFSLIVLTVYTFIAGVITFVKEPSAYQIVMIVKNVYATIPEYFFLQNTGFFDGGTNYPLWQLCTLLISGYFIYGILHKNEKLAREFILPAAILMIQAYLDVCEDGWGTVLFFHAPILRAFSPVCMGVLAYYFTTTSYYQYIRSKKLLFNLASIFAFLSIYAPQGYHNIYLITFVFLMLAMYDPESWINKLLNRKIFKSFGQLSYAIFLNHAMVIDLLKDQIFPLLFGASEALSAVLLKHAIFLVVLTAYSYFTIFIVNKLVQRFAQKRLAAVQK